MVHNLFFSWFERLDHHIGRRPGREILLFFDNCSTHGSLHAASNLEHIKVYFIPPNTTRKIQPLVSEIIPAMKENYRRLSLFMLFENINAGRVEIQVVTLTPCPL